MCIRDRSLVIPQIIFSQLDDIGITIQKNPGHTVRDSLDFFIIEGSSPIFNQNIEGAAINIAGDEIESVLFTVNDGQNNTWIYPESKWKEFSLGNIDIKSFNIRDDLFYIDVKKIN